MKGIDYSKKLNKTDKKKIVADFKRNMKARLVEQERLSKEEAIERMKIPLDELETIL